ncbi:hypothetical protein CSPX01_13778 [Colletotrichum filicis]|nr:hypothetical protein CSPX01_13778 [Colletotrichum filicis]
MRLALGLLDENTFWVSQRALGRPRSSFRRLAGASARASASDHYNSGWLGSWSVGRSTPSAAKHQDHPAPVENVSPFCRSNLAPEQSLRAKGARSSLASIHGGFASASPTSLCFR